jgi:hypothetical protein
MGHLFGVCNNEDPDTVFTYEANTSLEAAELYLEGSEKGDVVRVWALPRHPPAFVKLPDENVAQLSAYAPKVVT